MCLYETTSVFQFWKPLLLCSIKLTVKSLKELFVGDLKNYLTFPNLFTKSVFKDS